MEFINKAIGAPLGYVMWLCYTLFKNYGLAILGFTIFTKLLMFPISIWVQKNSIKMIKLQPRLNFIAVENVGSRDRIAEKQMALYKEENYKPLLGMIPLLIQIPIILGLIAVVYNPLQHLLHIDGETIAVFVQKASEIYDRVLGSTVHMKVIELVNNPIYTQLFAELNAANAVSAIEKINALDLVFLGINLSATPSFSSLLIVPLLSGFSAFLLSLVQNSVNVLQLEANWFGKWGMAIFLTAFSLYFAFIVPAGVGLYWIFSNIISILIMLLVNVIIPPKKHIDYKLLNESKIALEKSKEFAKKLRPSTEQKAKAKADYKAFFANDDTKPLVFYSEKSGFYKYYKRTIEYITENSDIIVHYITSDPNDQVFDIDNDQIVPYYIDDSRLIVLFMKIDVDVFVMTMPDIAQYQYKRSIVRKDAEYIYMFHYPLSTTMVLRKGALDNYNTIFCVGEFQFDEIRQTEEHYGLDSKELVLCGYPLLEELQQKHDTMQKTKHNSKKVLIAPSWQEDNILDSCIHDILQQLLGKGYLVVVRPHPEYVKRYMYKMNSIVQQYEDYEGDDLKFELDFSDSRSLFDSDVIITDWSGSAYEFSFVTKRPAIFINTTPKINNPEYDVIDAKPLELTLRSQIGLELELNNLNALESKVKAALNDSSEYNEKITKIRDKYISNFGNSAQIGGQYIIDAVNKKVKNK